LDSPRGQPWAIGGESVRVSGRAAGLILSIGLLCGCSQQAEPQRI